jgi:hypothetical protein
LKFIHKLTGRKEFDGTFEIELEHGIRDSLNGTSCSKMAFFETIIRLLKQFGCLLNHIRPEFLLESEEFIQLMSRESNWKNYSAYYLKNHLIMHREAWLILLYQLYSQFWCQRQKLEPLTSKPQSNVYSNVELSVLRWVKTCYEAVNELDDAKNKFMSFGKDYQDCIAPIHCLLRYANPARKAETLNELNKRPITNSELLANTKILYKLLERLNVVPLIYEDEYPSCTDKEIFLFMHQLYELLPQLLPKGPPVIFSCELGSATTKNIEIKNPSAKVVHYWVKIEGSRDFHIEDKECISIEPKSAYNFAVDFKARLSVEQVAYLSLFSKQDSESNSANGTALVFELRSKVTGRQSSKRLENISCPLYDSTCIKVFVENVFENSEVANFSISLVEESLDQPTRKVTQYSQDLESNNENNKAIMQFHCESDSIRIKKGFTGTVDLYFAPVRMGRTKCLLIFHDPSVGEFQYEVTGMTEIPRPLQELRIPQQMLVGKRERVELSLPVYNSYMLKC